MDARFRGHDTNLGFTKMQNALAAASSFSMTASRSTAPVAPDRTVDGRQSKNSVARILYVALASNQPPGPGFIV
jgi:hypothetical protein